MKRTKWDRYNDAGGAERRSNPVGRVTLGHGLPVNGLRRPNFPPTIKTLTPAGLLTFDSIGCWGRGCYNRPASQVARTAVDQGGSLSVGRILCVANQKGGVGKTTTAVNLAVGAAKGGCRTLLVDLDPQCNATSGLGCQPTDRHPLVAHQPLSQSLVETETAGLALLPGGRSFHDVEVLAGRREAESTLVARHLAASMVAYEMVLIDCPPSLGPLTQTALASSTEVLMPIQCEYFALEGLTQIIEIIRRVMHQETRRLQFGGIVLTMYDHGLELTGEVEKEVRDFFGEIVFTTVIPRDVSVAEAPSHGLSVLDYAPRTRGARAYVELCMEVLERV